MTSPANISTHISRYFGISENDLFSKKRTKNVALTRQVYMYFLKTGCRMTTIEIGKICKRDHSTVCYSVEKVLETMSACEVFQKQVRDLYRECFPNFRNDTFSWAA